MSREGAGSKKTNASPAAGTPIWVSAIYGLGILAAVVIVVVPVLLRAVDALTGDVPVNHDPWSPATIVWTALALAALTTWIVRRRRR